MTEYLTTRELAELLRIKERKVYDLAASGEVPCTRATGKLLFPRQGIDRWLALNASQAADVAPRPEVIVGSHDPLLDWALRASQCGLASYFDSSVDGLLRFGAREGIACGLHIGDGERWNVDAVQARFQGAPVVLVEWALRRRGIILSTAMTESIMAPGDLAGRRIVPRQAGAGSQILLEALLADHGVDRGSIDWAPPALSEADAVIEVAEGRADACFGLQTLASQFRLGFVAVIEERYDILVDRRAWFEATWQDLLAFCRGAEYRDYAAGLAGYDVSSQFRVHFNGD